MSQIDEARKAGYSDAEIAQHLAGAQKYTQAKNAGYSDSDILTHFGAPAPKVDMALKDPSEYDPQSKAFQQKYGALSGQSNFENVRAGVGKAFSDLGTGVEQLAAGVADVVAPRTQTLSDLVKGKPMSRVDELRQQVADTRQRDAALMDTKAGKAGNIAGNIVATIPALAIPGANTVVGAGLVGAGLGLVQPSTSTKETLINTGVGGAAGAGGQWLGGKIAQGANALLAKRAAGAAEEESGNAVRDAILQKSRDAGYVIPPTAVNDSGTATALESVAGKASLRQVASQKNAAVTNRLIADDLGILAGKPITRDALQAVRQKAGEIYKAVGNAGKLATDDTYAQDLKAIAQAGTDVEAGFPGIGAQANEKVKDLVTSLAQASPDARQALEAFKFLNERAKENFKSAFTGNSQALELARAQKAGADAIGDLIERNLQGSGSGELADAWRDARVTIAKSHAAEAALKGGNIDAGNLVRQLRAGKPLSGGFKTVADFADNFGDVSKLPQSGAGVSKLAAAIGGGGAVTSLAMGHPALAATEAALAATPWATRNMLLSRVGQSAFATPSYAPGLIGQTTLKSLAALGARGQVAGPVANALVQASR